MKNNRREFIKKTSLLGLGMAGTGFIGCTRQPAEPFPQTHRQTFNMSGYAAPKLDVVRIGIIGLGNRGSGTVTRLACIEGVEIKALCDLKPDRVSRAVESIYDIGHRPDSYSGHEDEWKKVCERADIDLISINTPWDLHVPMQLYAMENDKHTYTELPAANTIEECWQLVETSERTRKHCVQMSSSCHGGSLATVLNMVREGFFGDVIHAEGAYIHQLLVRYLFSKTTYPGQWRLKENIDRHGNLYPQHGFVPILQMLDINYGDKMDYMASISTNDFMMADFAEKLADADDFWEPYVGKDFRGDMNTSIIRTINGRSIMMQHDTSSPRPGVRFDMISGTKGIYKSRPDRIATHHDTGWMPQDEFNSLMEKYMPEMTKRFNELSRQANMMHTMHGGYSRTSPTDWRLIDCLRNGLPVEMNVYEAAASSALTPLSEWCVANRTTVPVPDFTDGSWNTNPRDMDVQLQKGGGTTRLL